MGHQKAEKVSLHPINRQQQKKKGHIQKRCDDIIPHANPLLAQPLGHGIGDGIAVEKGNHDGVKLQTSPGLFVLVEPETQGPGVQKNQPAEKHAIQHGRPQPFLHQVLNPAPLSGGVAPGQLRNQQLCQCEENAGGKHHHRKHHAADAAKGAHRVCLPREQG